MTEGSDLIAAITPLIADLAESGNGCVALAGSRGKGRADRWSDYDFRVYAESFRGPDIYQTVQWKRFEKEMAVWQAKGFRLDGVWMRNLAGVRRDLDAWIAGSFVPKSFEWTIWDYQLPTDLANQEILHDPQGMLFGWKQELRFYPEALRASLLTEYMEILRYWSTDYHYVSKIERADLVFLVGLTGKLANAILQVIFAANSAYFPGDGWNLPMAAELPMLPQDFISRMTAILEPGHDSGARKRQREQIIAVVNDLEALIVASNGQTTRLGVQDIRAG